jgi:hypothetical protein
MMITKFVLIAPLVVLLDLWECHALIRPAAIPYRGMDGARSLPHLSRDVYPMNTLSGMSIKLLRVCGVLTQLLCTQRSVAADMRYVHDEKHCYQCMYILDLFVYNVN